MGVVYCSHLGLGNRFRLGYNQVATATLLLVLSFRNLYWQASVVLTGELEKDGGFSLDWKTQQDCKPWNLKCTAHRFMRCPWDVPKNYYVHQLPTLRKGSSKWYDTLSPIRICMLWQTKPVACDDNTNLCGVNRGDCCYVQSRHEGGRELPKKNIHLLVFLDSSRPVQQQLGGWKRKNMSFGMRSCVKD